MTLSDPKPWEPLSQFSWIQERETLIVDKRKRLENGELETDERGGQRLEYRIPLEEVMKYTKFAKDHEEYWRARQLINDWWQENLDYDGNAITHFFGFFREWYCMKFDSPYEQGCFMVADGALQAILAGKLGDDLDSEEMKDFLVKAPSVIRDEEIN